MFKGLGLNVDSLENQIYLPASRILARALGVAVHRGRHLKVYEQSIKEVLDEFLKDEDLSSREAKIKNLLDAMRIGFKKGDLHMNKLEGLDVEDQRKYIKEFIHGHSEYLKRNAASLEELRDDEEIGRQMGHPYFALWHAILGDRRKEKIALDAIKKNPRTNVSAGNRHLENTPFSKFSLVDDDFKTPPSTPYDPTNIHSLPPFVPPSVGWLNQPEGFTRSDPRFAGRLPAFPHLDPSEQRLGQLPPTTATPSAPSVHLFDPFTGAPNPGAGPSPILNPDPPNAGMPPASLYAGSGLAALAVLFPAVWPYLAALGAGYAATAPAWAAGAESGNASKDGSVFATGAAPFNTFNPFAQSRAALGHALGNPGEHSSPVSEGSTSFVDRFGAWIDNPSGSVSEGDTADTAAAVTAWPMLLEEARRQSPSNGSSAGSAFASGSAPIPFLPDLKFEDRFGSWNTRVYGDSSGQTSKPTGTFSGEPGYLIPPPIFGVEGAAGPLGDAESWFSRWIKPNFGP